jgi:hypothetical protein
MILKVLLIGLEDFFIYGHVMLSEAKHLVLRKQTLHEACPERTAEILRFAQDDTRSVHSHMAREYSDR